MSYLKKILFGIIIIQIFVVLLLTNKSTRTFFINNKRTEPSSLNVISTVKSLRTPVFSKREKEQLLQTFIETKKDFSTLVKSQIDTKILYSQEVYLKMTESLKMYAKNFLGKPYVWGAVGPNKFDCSGFTKTVYGKWGITIPRYSGHQAEVGEYVKYENLQRGDLVFFDTAHKPTGKVNHVGIYLEDGKFIHASSGNKKVVITDFNKKIFYKNRFLWGRRVIQPKVIKIPQLFSQNSIEYINSLIL